MSALSPSTPTLVSWPFFSQQQKKIKLLLLHQSEHWRHEEGVTDIKRGALHHPTAPTTPTEIAFKGNYCGALLQRQARTDVTCMPEANTSPFGKMPGPLTLNGYIWGVTQWSTQVYVCLQRRVCSSPKVLCQFCFLNNRGLLRRQRGRHCLPLLQVNLADNFC